MDLRAILMGLAFALVWSSAFTSGHIVVAAAPPITALTVRFLIAGATGVALARMLGQDWRLGRPQWRAIVVFGLCQNALYLGLFWKALARVDAGLAAIIAATMPLVVAGLGRLVFGDRVPVLGLIGLIVGFAGVALIFAARLSGGADPLGLTMCVVGTLGLAVATLSMRGAGAGRNVLMIVGLQMLVGAAALAPFTLAETWAVHWSPRFVLAFLYTIVVPGLLATWIWFLLVARIGAVRAATFHFLNPVFGVAIAAVLLGERFGLIDLAGVTIVTVGILAVQMSRQRR